MGGGVTIIHTLYNCVLAVHFVGSSYRSGVGGGGGALYIHCTIVYQLCILLGRRYREGRGGHYTYTVQLCTSCVLCWDELPLWGGGHYTYIVQLYTSVLAVYFVGTSYRCGVVVTIHTLYNYVLVY